MNSESNRCEQYELELSSFLDGELPPAAAAEALEHAFGCASCRDFYRRARALQEAAAGLRAEDLPASDVRADALWNELSTRAGLGREAARPRSRAPRWLRAAALVALGVGAGYLSSLLREAGAARPEASVAAAPSNPALVATAAAPAPGGSQPATMDEHRFVALADELLRSDVRYQRAMLEVLRLVPALETGEGLKTEEPRDGFVRASTVGERPRRGAI